MCSIFWEREDGVCAKQIVLFLLPLPDGVALRARLAHSEAITTLALSRGGGHTAVTGSKDRSLKVWNAHTGYLTQVWCIEHISLNLGRI